MITRIISKVGSKPPRRWKHLRPGDYTPDALAEIIIEAAQLLDDCDEGALALQTLTGEVFDRTVPKMASSPGGVEALMKMINHPVQE